MKRPPTTPPSVDGRRYSPETEERLNWLAWHLFEEGQAGADFLNYLENITLRDVLPAGSSAEHLGHKEGQRWIVGLIRQRINLHKETRHDRSSGGLPGPGELGSDGGDGTGS